MLDLFRILDLAKEKIFNFLLASFSSLYMFSPMNHTDHMKTDFSYKTEYDNKTGKLTFTISRGDTFEEITLSYWEAFLLSEKLNLEFCKK